MSLSKAIDTDIVAMRRRVNKLVGEGTLAISRQSPKSATINSLHPCANEIRLLAGVLARQWIALPPMHDSPPPSLEWLLPTRCNLLALLGGRGRTHVLAALSVLDEIPITRLANMLGMRRYVVDQLFLGGHLKTVHPWALQKRPARAE